MGQALRMLRVHKDECIDKENQLAMKQRGVCKSMLDQNFRLLRMAWNKLLEETKAREAMLRDKLKFVLKTLTDKDSAMALMAYNAMKRRKLMMDGVGQTNAELNKKKLIKRLMNQGYNLQLAAIRGLKVFMRNERLNDKEKTKILKRMLFKALREQGQA